MRRGGLVVLALCVVALPWLAIKYAPVAAALAAVGLWRLRGTGGGRAAAALGAGAAAGAVGVPGRARTVYGGWTVYAGGDRTSSTASSARSATTPTTWAAAGAWWACWWTATSASRRGSLRGCCCPGRRGAPRAAPAAARPRCSLPLAAGWLVATFVALTMQGWWFPGRQLVVVLPARVPSRWPGGPGRAAPACVAAVALGAVGVVAQAFIVAEGLLGRIAWVVDLQTTADPLYRAIRWITPDYLTEDAATWPLHWAWAAAFVALAVWAWRREGGALPRRPRADEPALVGEDDRLDPVAQAQLARMLATCVFTVCSLTTSSPAISAFDRPRATRRRTSTSR